MLFDFQNIQRNSSNEFNIQGEAQIRYSDQHGKFVLRKIPTIDIY